MVDTDAPVERRFALEIFAFAGSLNAQELLPRALNARAQLTLSRESDGSGSFVSGGSVGLLPPAAVAAGDALTATLWLRGRVEGTASAPALLIDRAVRVSYVRGQSGTTRVFLPVRCADRSVGCSSVADDDCTVSVRCREQGATCGDLGECVSVDTPVSFSTPDGALQDSGTISAVDASAARADTGVLVDPTVPAPRQIGPLSLGDVNVTRPRFAWQLPAQTDGALLTLCADRQCARVLETVRGQGSNVRPTRDLPTRSVVFWRLQGLRGAAVGTTMSPTWLLHIAPSPVAGAMESSTHAHCDVDGDGFDDVVIGAPQATPGGRMNAGIARVYHGSAMGLASSPRTTLEGTAPGDFFGWSAAAAGDVNGDGFGDVVIGAPQLAPGGRRLSGGASVYLGGPMGLSSTAVENYIGATANDQFGYSVAGAGDVNGDGYADVVVGAITADLGAQPTAGSMSIYHGNSLGISSMPARVVFGNTADSQLGNAVSSAGDVNADGFSDVVVGSYQATPAGRSRAGTASVFLGSANGVGAAPVNVLAGTASGDLFGISVAAAGDVNGDGYSDVVVGARHAAPGGAINVGSASIFLGAADGLSPSPARVLAGAANADQFGEVVAGAGDLNGDGFSDVLVGVPRGDSPGMPDAGSASFFYGGPMGIAMAPTLQLRGSLGGDTFGSSLAGVGDVNGDGLDDTAIAAVLATFAGVAMSGSVGVYYGSRAAISTTPSQLLTGRAPMEMFGHAIAF